jgi:bifunctional non-homologous end joining protein LigD
LAQIEAGRRDTTLTIGVDSLKVTNLDKEMWPASGDLPPVTKRDLLTYFAKMGGVIVPHVANRPLTLTRYPNGVAGKSFYQKQWTQTMPPFVEPVALWTDENSADGDYLLCNNVPTLLWLGQLADLALHVSLARTVPGPEGATASTTFGGSKSQIEKSLLNYPDFLLFDLDPFIPEEGETSVEKNALTRAGFEQTRRAALWLKELLDSAGLRSFVKTSGASGIHVFVPIVRNLTYDVVRAVCNAIAGALVAAHPKEVTTQFDKTKRVGKVYIDVNQNGRIKSLAAIYSPRTNPGAPVSMPLRWDEVAQADPLAYNIWTAPDRVAAVGDIWAGILEAKQDVRSLVDL